MREKVPLTLEPAHLPRTLDELETILTRHGVPESVRGDLRLIAEEAVTNVLKYASARTIELALELEAHQARLELRDDGLPYDPLGAPSPDLESPLEERPIGGLGIHLLKELTDEIQYRREAGFNILLLTKRLG